MLLGQGQADVGNCQVSITSALIDNTYRLAATATNLIGKSAASEGLTINRTNPSVSLPTVRSDDLNRGHLAIAIG